MSHPHHPLLLKQQTTSFHLSVRMFASTILVVFGIAHAVCANVENLPDNTSILERRQLGTCTTVRQTLPQAVCCSTLMQRHLRSPPDSLAAAAETVPVLYQVPRQPPRRIQVLPNHPRRTPVRRRRLILRQRRIIFPLQTGHPSMLQTGHLSMKRHLQQ